MGQYRTSYPCKECEHDNGKCVGRSRKGQHKFCFSQKVATNADRILANVKDVDCLTELIWCDSWHDVFGMPEFDSKQELLDWLQQPAATTS